MQKIKKNIILLFVFLILVNAFAVAQTITIKNYKTGDIILRLDGNVIKDSNYNTIATINGNILEDRNGNTIAAVYGNTINAANGSTIASLYGNTIEAHNDYFKAEIDGHYIKERNGNTIAKIYGNPNKKQRFAILCLILIIHNS
ncbi:MAG: hypothetical protein CR988_01430 [Treponema sp.]|nr:MAG: hypothetical protein CR988_01430 [Treponema sp.]